MKLSLYIGIVFSFFSIWSYGQSTRIEISDFMYILNGDENICEGNVRLTAYFTDGRTEVFFEEDRYHSRTTYTEEDFAVQLSGIVESIGIYAYVRERRDGRSCDSGHGSVIEHDVLIPVNPNPCVQGIYHEYIRNGGDFEVGSELRIRYRVIPRPEITRVTTTDIAGYDDNLSIQATIGYNSSVYNWQYGVIVDEIISDTPFCRINPTASSCRTPIYEWYDISISNSNRLNIVPSSFLGSSLIGERIAFRTTACDDIGSDNFVYYDLRRSAPHIINTHSDPVSCYDSQDGQIRITFDRPLEPGDNLNITVADMSRRAAGTDEYERPNYEIVEGVGLENITELDENNSIVLNNLPPSTTQFRVDILGAYNGINYYSGAENHSEPFTITRPTAPVSFQITNVINVWCNDGDTDPTNNNDGEIHLRADGGNDGAFEFSITGENQTGDWQDFSESDTHEITGLRPGNYNIRVRKRITLTGVYCDAKEQTVVDGETLLGEIIVLEQEITQPEEHLQLAYEAHIEPTAFGFTNGSITARVFGGTPISGNSYDFEWHNSNGTLMTDTSTSYVSGQGYFITLNNIPADTYFLTVTDANYNQATYKTGCTVVESEFKLEQPDPLQVIFEETNSISCNSENIRNDPYSDGELTAYVSGGVPLELFDNSGLPYFYTWKKRIDGQWVVLEAEQDNILSGISHGEYALNIRDANGIILGDYEHNTLVRETDSTVTLLQPELLDISHSKTNPTCAQGNNGSATIEISGGTPPYSVSWSNGASTYVIEDLTSGKYLAYVTDSKGCRAVEEITLEQPDGMLPIAVGIPPTCYLGNDGIIEVVTEGGIPPYSYLWDTGETTPYISNLEAGTYRLQITDAQNCVTYIEETLEETPPLAVDLGEDRTICDWQWLELDVAIDDPGAVYQWDSDNGFESDSPVVQLTEPGTYRATITTSKGCTGIDEIEVKTSTDPIDAHFALSTQAFADEEVLLVNISSPVGDRVVWTIPEGVKLVYEANNKIIVLFDEPGTYDINLRSYQGDCYQDYTKNIIVEEASELQDIGDSKNPFIEEFIVYPNPSNGNFKIKLSLAEEANIAVKVISLITSKVMNVKNEGGSRDFLLEYDLQHLPSGVYLLLLETPKGDEIRKLVFD